MFRSFPLIALAVSVAAQSIPDSCRDTLGSLLVDPDVSACLNSPPLLTLISGNSSSSIVPVIDSWLPGFCSAPACSNATIASAVHSYISGCAADFGDEPTTLSIDYAVDYMQKHFPALRRVSCLKQGGDHCTTKTLEYIESTRPGDPLPVQAVAILLLNPLQSVIPPIAACTDCTKQAYNILVEAAPEIAASWDPIPRIPCGESFVDGANVDGVTESASSDTNDNGAAGLLRAASIAVSKIVVVSSVFALFA